MDGAMGNEEEVVEAVVTCEGDFHDPELLNHLELFRLKLTEILLLEDESVVNLKKIEPWNSVKVTFTIPREAALRLRQLAQAGSEALRQMGILSVQLQGDSSISLKIVGRNNETTELTLHTSKGATSGLSSGGPPSLECGTSTASEVGSSPGPSNQEVTRKNIVDYLIQGPPHLRPTAIFNSILGVNASTNPPFLGTNRGVPPSPDPFSGIGNNRPILRPNSIANMPPLPNSALRGSHPNSFSLAKTSGAFHIPIHNQSSAGQSSSDFSNSQMNSFSINKSGPGHINSSGLHSGSQQKNMAGAMNTFGPIGSKLPSSSNISSTLPPSSSGFMIDLPPPPPYPHSSCNNTAKPGKQVSASSPLLVNLLQTDPISVAAGMASANTTTAGSSSPAPPVKKKKRSKKPKESISNSLPNAEDTSHNKDMGVNPNLFNPAFSSVSGLPMSSAPFLSSKLQKEYFPDIGEAVHAFSHVNKSVESRSVSDKSFKPLMSSDRPFSENSANSSAFTLTKLNTSVSSAIGTDHVRSSEANGQGELSKELIDSFSREIAAGKIINPYTGQLEPRDSMVESNNGKFKDHPVLSEERISSRVVSNKTRDIGGSCLSDVPVSVSQIMDINVLRNFSTVSCSTAAFFHSGSSPQLSSDKLSSPNPHRRNPSDNSVSANKNIYAAKLNSKSESDNCLLTSASISSTLSQSIFSTQHQVSASSIQHQVKCSKPSPVIASSSSFIKTQQGRSVMNQIVQGNLPPHVVPSSSLSSGVSESVINSSLGSSCSSSLLPIDYQDSFVRRLEHNPTLFQLTSCANSNTQSSFLHHPLSSSKMFSSSSQSVVQNRPVPSPVQTSFQASERLKSTVVSKPISSQHVQAASSDSISTTTKTNFPHLLNSHPEKSLDQQVMVQSPLEKVSPEGDDNSNHSGLASENIPESTGTSALLEHANVKAENHDSGVGSSSERSDDTPSEPGDGEFRANANCSESDEANKTKRLVNYKGESGTESAPANTITVGYMMSSIETVSQPKSSQLRDSGHESIKTTNLSHASGSNVKIAKFLDSHVHSLDKNTELSTNLSLSSADWMGNDSMAESSTYSSKMRLNGPSHVEKEDGFKVIANKEQMNGPTSKEMEELLMTMADLQGKSEQLSSKRVFKRHDLQLQQEVLEEMAKLEKEDSTESIPRGLVGIEDRQDQFPFFDMEELVNGKIFGNGTSSIDKTGSNITSIYSKRSSPVNVNMLNHIYAPGLPLPRRLTESVQRLVKPLPASESSMPQMRLCKSPGTGSPRAGSGVNGPSPSRMTLHSGTRSPGASIPKLVPNDKHSLLSGGLDLAGLSKFPLNSLPHSEFASESVPNDSSSRMLGLTTDFLSKDGANSGFLSSCHVSPPLLTDSLAYTHKMLSQSYPPHKCRDPSNSVGLHDLFSHMQPNSLIDSVPITLQDQNTRQSKSSCESAITSYPQMWAIGHRQNSPKMGVQTDSLSVSTLSNSVSTRVSVPETLTKNQEAAPLTKSFKTQEIPSLSSPNHSNSFSPTINVNTDQTESSSLSNINSSTFQSVSETGAAAPWAKISLNNGSNISQMKQKIAISKQKNVPYVTLSSSSVASSLSLTAKSAASRLTVSGSVIGDTPRSLVDNLTILKSTKSDATMSPRALKSDLSLTRSSPVTSVLSRNLFESVSCDLTTLSQRSVVQTSRNKTVDTLVSHSSSKSVLDLNHAQDLNFQVSKASRKTVDSTLGPISPELNYNSEMVMNSLQSIRTNETPSTSLPAQVVHLDFPHLPPTVSETSIGKSALADHVLPVSQKVVKSPIQPSKVVINHNWSSAPTTPTLVTGFPVKPSLSNLDPLSHTKTSDRIESKHNKDSEKNVSPLLAKEPILETLAFAFGTSLKANPEGQSNEVGGSSLNTLSHSLTLTKEEVTDREKGTVDKIALPSSSNKTDCETLVSLPDQSIHHSAGLKRVARKRSLHLMECDQNDDQDESAADHCAEKRIKLESLSKSDLNETGNILAREPKIDENNLRTNNSSHASPKAQDESKELLADTVLSNLGDKCSTEDQQASIHNSASETRESSDSSKNNLSENETIKDTSISVTPDALDTIQPNVPEHVTSSNDNEVFKDTHNIQVNNGESEPQKMTVQSSEHIQNKDISLQEASDKDKEEMVSKEQSGKNIESSNLDENNSNESLQNTQDQNQIRQDTVENVDQDPLTTTLDDGAKKGHRTKRQFYAYVPEKSIDQTYFDTPILSGRTRSRNKPSEPTDTANQEVLNTTIGPSDSNSSVLTSLKADSTDAVGNKRATRSLRTKDNSQDFNATKRRRLQTRDHR